jgi:NADPH2:quinone reductase
VLEQLGGLGADAVISLDQEPDSLVEKFRAVLEDSKIDVVLDYLWGQPAERLLDAIAQKGLSHSARRIRFVQIGNSAGRTISLAGATLRSSGLELLGSGFGSASIEQILQAVGELFRETTKQPFQNVVKGVPLRELEAYWNGREENARIVFLP